jgi:hypothetical protein
MRPQSILSRFSAVALIVCLIGLSTPTCEAYSVLTHEQIVDFLWESQIKKLLLKSYPDTTPEQLRKAHAYAYGGSLIQDMGYYPSGNKFFSDLVHYVRSGDFVAELVRDSRDVNDLAFALGALAHYASDTTGHPAVNHAVALEFPKLRRKYGNTVTYADDAKAHIQTEFGFDVLQVAKQLYTPDAYHDFIGFEVAQPLLDRAFSKTYGIELKDIFNDEDRAIGSYRRAVAKWIPELTRVALITKRKELEALPNFSPKRFRYLLSRTQYEKNWGRNYKRPGVGARIMAFFVKILPKVGPLRALDIKPPTPETEKMYIQSVEGTVTNYQTLLSKTGSDQMQLPNLDFDTGVPTAAGEYNLADKTYAKLLERLSKDNFAHVSPELKQQIVSFYGDLHQPIETKKHKDKWRDTLKELDQLKSHSAPGNSTATGPAQ